MESAFQFRLSSARKLPTNATHGTEKKSAYSANNPSWNSRSEIRLNMSGIENSISPIKLSVITQAASATTAYHTNNGTITKPRINGGI